MPLEIASPATLTARLSAPVRRMDWYRGLRAAVALSAPLVVGDLAHNDLFGWAALGGFEAIIADTGGSYRRRLGNLAALSWGGALPGREFDRQPQLPERVNRFLAQSAGGPQPRLAAAGPRAPGRRTGP